MRGRVRAHARRLRSTFWVPLDELLVRLQNYISVLSSLKGKRK